MSDTSSRAEAFNRWWSLGSTIIAPATLLSTLLFYFGYVSSRAQYRYFGLDVDTVGLSTQDYVMRSPQALLVPLLTLTLGGAALLLVHLAVRRHPPPRAAVHTLLAVGALALLGGVVLVATYAQVGTWSAYPLVTPLLLAGGSAGALYALRLPGAPALLGPTDVEGRALRRGVLALALVAIVGCLFWATATIAEWSGLGNGMRTARHLDRLPPVVLDTRERLFLTDGIVEETSLPKEEGNHFRYRYRGLRLLVQGDGRLFLVPDTWSASASTIVVPMDDSVRVRFRFVNRAP